MLIEVTEVVGGRGSRDAKAYLAAAQIRFMTKHADSDYVYRITDTQGERWDVSWFDVKGLVNPITHTIAADGKTKILICDRDERSEGPWAIIGDSPVIGWLVRANGEIEPAISGNLSELTHNRWAILYPDGQVDEPHNGVFGDKEIWLADINRKFIEPPEDDLIG